MTDRDELIGELSKAAGDAMNGYLDAEEAQNIALSVLKVMDTQGWRPPPSGDVIEQAARVLDPGAFGRNGTSEHRAEALYRVRRIADAGLLATPPDESCPGRWRPMPECERCGVTVHDLPFEELGLSAEDAAETMFEHHGGKTLCQGCYGEEDR